MPCHLLLAKVAVKAGDQILGSLDQLVPGLDKTLSAKTRTEAVKQEVCNPPCAFLSLSKTRRTHPCPEFEEGNFHGQLLGSWSMLLSSASSQMVHRSAVYKRGPVRGACSSVVLDEKISSAVLAVYRL